MPSRCVRLRTTQRRLCQSWASAAADIGTRLKLIRGPTNFNNQVCQGRLGMEVEARRVEATV